MRNTDFQVWSFPSTCLQESKKNSTLVRCGQRSRKQKIQDSRTHFFWIPKKAKPWPRSKDMVTAYGSKNWLPGTSRISSKIWGRETPVSSKCELFVFQTWCETLQGWICCMLPIGVRYLVSDLCGMAEALGLVLMQPSTDNILSSLHDDSSTPSSGIIFQWQADSRC